MARTIWREPVRKAPRMQVAARAARKSAPSTGPRYVPSSAPRKSAPSTGPPLELLEDEEAIYQAGRSSTSTSPSSFIDLTGSPSTTSASPPPSHTVTTAEVSLVGEGTRQAIATVSEQHLRSAILKVCTQSAETAQLLGPLLTPSALGITDRKRKRSPEICENCCEEIDDDGDGCCKWRRMDLARWVSFTIPICGRVRT